MDAAPQLAPSEKVAIMTSWPERQPLPPTQPRVPTMTADYLPPQLEGWLMDQATRGCIPLDMVAIPALVAAAGIVGKTAEIQPFAGSGWVVKPSLWGMVVAPPGSQKSSAIFGALEYLRVFEEDAREEYKQLAIEAEVNAELLDAGIKKALKTGSSLEAITLKKQQQEAREVTRARLLVTDITAEKLGELLQQNPAGLTMVRDELGSWLGHLEKPEQDMARGLMLTAWDGQQPYTYDRITRGTIDIPQVCLSVIGGIQPRPLQVYLERIQRDGLKEDGLLQRFGLITWPDLESMPPWVDPGPAGQPSKAARLAASRVYSWLLAIRKKHTNQPLRAVFSAEAAQNWGEWHTEIKNRARAKSLEDTPTFAGWLAKLPKLAAGLALLFHLIRCSAGEEPGLVSLEDLELAQRWVIFAEAHAQKVYSWEVNRAVYIAHEVANKLEAGYVYTTKTTARDFLRTGWRGMGTPEEVATVLSILEGAGWVNIAIEQTGGRPSRVVYLHPDLHPDPDPNKS